MVAVAMALFMAVLAVAVAAASRAVGAPLVPMDVAAGAGSGRELRRRAGQRRPARSGCAEMASGR